MTKLDGRVTLRRFSCWNFSQWLPFGGVSVVMEKRVSNVWTRQEPRQQHRRWSQDCWYKIRSKHFYTLLARHDQTEVRSVVSLSLSIPLYVCISIRGCLSVSYDIFVGSAWFLLYTVLQSASHSNLQSHGKSSCLRCYKLSNYTKAKGVTHTELQCKMV